MSLLVMYAKVIDSKEDGPLMVGIYLGGIRSTREEANELAKLCVTKSVGGIIMPKIAPIDDSPNSFYNTVKEIATQFDKLAGRMYDAERVLRRNIDFCSG